MPINPQYVIAPNLEQYFVDRTTGFPLANGYVYCYSDINRSELKPVYRISGSPPDYTYEQLPNPIRTNAVGTLVDELGNNIIPYWYPYDADGNIELYYLNITDENGVQQFDRPAWPNTGDQANENGEGSFNYIPNGQFKIHTNVQSPTTETPGTITQPITILAQGGWTFERPSGSTANQIVTFVPFGSYTANPTSSPSYAFNLNVLSPGLGDLFQDTRIKFDDVNKFASDDNFFTFYCEGRVNIGSSINVDLVLIKNFGSGGSPETQTVLTTFTFTNSYTAKQFSFVFGANTGKTIGDGSYIQLALRFPNQSQNISFTNAALVIGNVFLQQFPYQTDADMRTRGIAGWMPTPAYDGSNVGSNLVLSQQGLSFGLDGDSGSGDIVASLRSSKPGYALMDGQLQYDTQAYDVTGIPYSRLFNTIPTILSGSGKNFLQVTQPESITNALALKINTRNTGTVPTNGTISPGFTFSAICAGAGAPTSFDYRVLSFIYGTNVSFDTFLIWNIEIGTSSATSAGTTGFTVSTVRNGSSVLRKITKLVIPAPPAASTYFLYGTPTLDFYVWYAVNGVGTDPAIVGRTGIKVDILSTDTIKAVCVKTYFALNGWSASRLLTVAAAAIPPGAYFNFDVFGGSITSYYLWFTIDGDGTDPAPSGRTGLLCPLLSTDTNAQVAAKIADVLNSRYYSVPDLRGLTLKQWDPSGTIDNGLRFNINNWTLYANSLGTQELDEILSHVHTYVYRATTLDQTGSSTPCWVGESSQFTGATGGSQTIVYNYAVNYFIKF